MFAKMELMVKTVLFLVSLSLAFYLARSDYPQLLIDKELLIDKVLPFKLIGAAVAGVMYTSFLTAPLSVVALYLLSQRVDPVLLGLVAGAGAMLGDILIVQFFRQVLRGFSAARHTSLFKWIKKEFKALHLDILAILLGVIIVASPFPDELGLILLGASKLSLGKLMILTYILNTVGIFTIVLPAYLLR